MKVQGLHVGAAEVPVLFRQLSDADSSTYTYLLACPLTREAVLVDAVRGQVERDLALVRDLGLTLRFTLETHVHADHITAAHTLRARTGCQALVSALGGAVGADRLLAHGDVVEFGAQALHVRATPGHTRGCLSYVTRDLGHVFTGDALLVRGIPTEDILSPTRRQGHALTPFAKVRGRTITYPAAEPQSAKTELRGKRAASPAIKRPRPPSSNSRFASLAVFGVHPLGCLRPANTLKRGHQTGVDRHNENCRPLSEGGRSHD